MAWRHQGEAAFDLTFPGGVSPVEPFVVNGSTPKLRKSVNVKAIGGILVGDEKHGLRKAQAGVDFAHPSNVPTAALQHALKYARVNSEGIAFEYVTPTPAEIGLIAANGLMLSGNTVQVDPDGIIECGTLVTSVLMPKGPPGSALTVTGKMLCQDNVSAVGFEGATVSNGDTTISLLAESVGVSKVMNCAQNINTPYVNCTEVRSIGQDTMITLFQGAATVTADVVNLQGALLANVGTLNAQGVDGSVYTQTLNGPIPTALDDITSGTLQPVRGGTGLSAIVENGILLGGNGNTVTQVTPPVNAVERYLAWNGSGCTWQPVENIILGLDVKKEVNAALLVDVSGTYLTGQFTAVDASTWDYGTSVPQLGDRVLVMGQTIQFENGIYEISVFASINNVTLSRATDMPEGSTFSGSEFCFSKGSLIGYIVAATTEPGIVGTNSMTWSQFNAANGLLPGNSLQINGNTLNVDPTSVKSAAFRDPSNLCGINMDGTKTTLFGGPLDANAFDINNVGAVTATAVRTGSMRDATNVCGFAMGPLETSLFGGDLNATGFSFTNASSVQTSALRSSVGNGGLSLNAAGEVTAAAAMHLATNSMDGVGTLTMSGTSAIRTDTIQSQTGQTGIGYNSGNGKWGVGSAAHPVEQAYVENIASSGDGVVRMSIGGSGVTLQGAGTAFNANSKVIDNALYVKTASLECPNFYHSAGVPMMQFQAGANIHCQSKNFGGVNNLFGVVKWDNGPLAVPVTADWATFQDVGVGDSSTNTSSYTRQLVCPWTERQYSVVYTTTTGTNSTVTVPFAVWRITGVRCCFLNPDLTTYDVRNEPAQISLAGTNSSTTFTIASPAIGRKCFLNFVVNTNITSV